MNKILLYSICICYSPLFYGQDTIKPIGYIKYKEINLNNSSLITSFIVTTIFGKSNNYISYFNNNFPDVTAFAKELTLLTKEKEMGAELIKEFENEAISKNKAYAENIEKVYLINSKSKERKIIYYFGFIDEPNCVVVDTIKTPEIIFQDSIKNILGYSCKKMIFKYKKTTLEIWYAEKLPFNAGPGHFHGAPGVILSVNEPKTGRGYMAYEVGDEKLENTLIKKIPLKYKNLIVTQQEYEILLEKENALNNLKLPKRIQTY